MKHTIAKIWLYFVLVIGIFLFGTVIFEVATNFEDYTLALASLGIMGFVSMSLWAVYELINEQKGIKMKDWDEDVTLFALFIVGVFVFLGFLTFMGFQEAKGNRIKQLEKIEACKTIEDEGLRTFCIAQVQQNPTHRRSLERKEVKCWKLQLLPLSNC